MRLAALGLLLLLAGCAAKPPPPPYVCVPAITSAGQSVLYCQPHDGAAR